MSKRIALFLTRRDEAQLQWAQTIRKESAEKGFALEESWNEESIAQNRAVSSCIFGDTADALIILPVSTTGPAALLKQIAAKEKALILLNRLTSDLDPEKSWSIPSLRKDHPRVLTVRVAPDERALGRTQGWQVQALLPKGGAILYVQGNMMTSGARDRTAGLEEVLGNGNGYEIGKVDGGWTSPRAEAALHDWFSLMLLRPEYRPRLVVSQSEVMVAGIRAALDKAATEFSRPDLLQLPITACDGMAEFKAAVDQGRLAATIEIPSRAAAAMKVLEDYWARGVVPTQYEVLLPPASYPSLDELSRRAL